MGKKAYLATLRCTNISPGSQPKITDSGTRESALSTSERTMGRILASKQAW